MNYRYLILVRLRMARVGVYGVGAELAFKPTAPDADCGI